MLIATETPKNRRVWIGLKLETDDGLQGQVIAFFAAVRGPEMSPDDRFVVQFSDTTERTVRRAAIAIPSGD